jgi:general secretion pathway protein F
MIFTYRAVNAEGSTVQGTVQARSLRGAMHQLQQRNLSPTSLVSREKDTAVSTRGVKPTGKRKPGSQELITSLHQLVVLLESGIALEEALESLADSQGNPHISFAFYGMLKAIKQGDAFSDAFGRCPLSFPDYFTILAGAGELTGKLPAALRDGIHQWERELANANTLRNALIYPAILVSAGIASVLLIFVFVVPKFVKLLEKTSGDVPLLARMVLGTGVFFNQYWLLIAALFCSGLFFLFYLSQSPVLRQRSLNLIYRVPVFHNWITETAVGSWAAILSTLLANRVALLTALELSCENIKITPLHEGFRQVQKSVSSGSRLAASLREMNIMTPAGYNLIQAGERSGRLPQMLQSLSTLYMTSSQNRIKRFLTLLEPAAILLIGGAVGLIMAGIILAITSANNVSI